MARRQPDTEVEPVVQRLRIRYAKRGRLRFASHRDFARALERAVRRAGVPIAHSAGFTPHPRISYVGAAPTGAASEAEYVELALTREADPAAVREALDEALPPGLDILDCVVAGSGSLPDRIDASGWRIELPDVPVQAAEAAVAAFLAADRVEVERRTKSGRRPVDVRAATVSLTVGAGAPTGPDQPGCAILDLVVRHTTPVARPDDVLAALRDVAGLAPEIAPRATRLAQGRLDHDGWLADPFAPDAAVIKRS
jgi:radical SAM-linked protein